MDIGTTFSGISYAILDPGEVPIIRGVTRFPAQENVGGDSKIPSILYYDQQGKVCAVGAEALQESVIEQAEDNGWIKLEWWKLHLRPKRLASSHVSDSDLPSLPPSKTAVEVLGDFIKYLLRCAQSYITDTYSETLWVSVSSNIDFVLTHPNGWEGAQQSEIRRAAVLAGLIPDTLLGQSRLQLLTEGEASLHYCLGNGLNGDTTTDGQGIIIVDAGGGTIDLSAYYMAKSPASFEEIAPTECRLQGSVFVSRRARTFLHAKLANSKFGTPEDLKNLVECFDKSTKLRFRNPDEPSYIRFGGVRDKDLAFGIRSGQLKLPGSEVAALFKPSIDGIVDAIEQQRRIAHKTIKSIFLVGGFAASDWLYSQLQAHISAQGINFLRPDSHVNKAVADGALSFYLDHRVSARVAKKTYGLQCQNIFEPADAQHRKRAHKQVIDAAGDACLNDIFSIILPKATRVSEEKEFRQHYYTRSSVKTNLYAVKESIRCYHGSAKQPKWMDNERNQYSVLCMVEADTYQLAIAAEPRYGQNGEVYYQIDFSIVLLFGLTELKAQVCWMEHGQEKRSPARVVYDIDETIADM